MSRPATVLTKSIRREVVAKGVALIVTLTPDGRLIARAKYRRRSYTVRLEELFPHCVAERGGESFDQLTLGSLVTPAAPLKTPETTTSGTSAAQGGIQA